MLFSELIKQRRSVRSYKDQPVEKEKITQCLEAARMAPSANNSQPWTFLVVEDKELKNRVAEATVTLGFNKFSREAPVLIVVIRERANLFTALGGWMQHTEFSGYDVGIAVSHFCLQAAELDLGTCILGLFDQKKIKELLHIESKKEVALVLTLGYTDAPVREKKRKPLEAMSRWYTV
jgi:nitroreductase